MRKLAVGACVFVFALSGCATLDHDDRAMLGQHNVSPAVDSRMSHEEPLAVPDIIELSKKGVPAPFVIRYLKLTEVTYRLTADDVSQLEKAAVSSDVINYLLATPTLYGPSRAPYPAPFPPDSYYYTDPFGPSDHMHHW